MTAAAVRKLQKDVDNALKKVEDGIDEFAHVWDQATNTSNNSQREKLGEELKKSINKLQRHRVQIREWIGQSDIKSNSKDKLEEARRRIEHDMQRFKEFERDLKTKAFSACALAKADALEVEEVEKQKYQEWLATTIQALNDQLDESEADLELLKNRRNPSADEKSRLAMLKTRQERHRWHMKKLELILRALDNDALDVTDLAIVRDSVMLYIEDHQNVDFHHDETLYDCFDLNEVEAPQERVSNQRPASTELAKETKEPRESRANGVSTKEESQKKCKDREKRKKGVTVVPTQPAVVSPKPEVVESQQEDLAADEVKVQADQLLGDAEEFICKICQIHVVGCSPKLTNCSHLFCGDCLSQWFAQHPESQTWAQRARSAGPERVVPCPVCKQALNEKRDLFPVCGATSRSENLLLWRMLSSLKITCMNHSKMRADGRCNWIGEYGQYQKHARSCKNQPVLENGAGDAPDTQESAVATSISNESKSDGMVAEKPTKPTQAQRVSVADPHPSPQSTSTPGWGSLGKAVPDAHSAVTPAAAAHNTTSNGSSVAGALPPGSATPFHRGTSALLTNVTVKATNAFEPTGSNMVAINAGDTVQVLERHQSGWAYCKNFNAPPNSCTGWAPSWIVQPAQNDDAVAAPKTKPQDSQAKDQRLQPAVAAAPTPQHAQAVPAQVPRHWIANDGTSPALKAPSMVVRAAVAPFGAVSASQLSLSYGDLVEIIERDTSGWTYGRKVSQQPLDPTAPVEGWFPDWVCAQK